MTTKQEAIKAAIEALAPFAREAELYQSVDVEYLGGKNIGDFRRARTAHALLSQVEAVLASTPPKPAAEDAVERAAEIIIDDICVGSAAGFSAARALAAANLLRTDKEPS